MTLESVNRTLSFLEKLITPNKPDSFDYLIRLYITSFRKKIEVVVIVKIEFPDKFYVHDLALF